MKEFGKISREGLIAANQDGLDWTPDQSIQSFHSPLLEVAYQLGLNSPDGFQAADLADCPIVTGYRYGKTTTGISHNYRNDTCEGGLSMAYLEGEKKEIHSAIFFRERELEKYTGFLLPFTGSDDEHLILPIDAIDDYDSYEL